jgi:hypothetical protein
MGAGGIGQLGGGDASLFAHLPHRSSEDEQLRISVFNLGQKAPRRAEDACLRL